uniref:Uncharacterized protein n=1 Tax=Anguilla anguilla TaxID=7936 RepID=A0A0E9UA06_ANGAN
MFILGEIYKKCETAMYSYKKSVNNSPVSLTLFV